MLQVPSNWTDSFIFISDMLTANVLACLGSTPGCVLIWLASASLRSMTRSPKCKKPSIVTDKSVCTWWEIIYDKLSSNWTSSWPFYFHKLNRFRRLCQIGAWNIQMEGNYHWQLSDCYISDPLLRTEESSIQYSQPPSLPLCLLTTDSVQWAHTPLPHSKYPSPTSFPPARFNTLIFQHPVFARSSSSLLKQQHLPESGIVLMTIRAYWSKRITTQLRISHGVIAKSLYLSSSPCNATSFTDQLIKLTITIIYKLSC